MTLSRARLEAAQRAMQEVIDAGIIDPGVPADRALDLFLAVTSGITNQHLANEPHLPVGQGRFGSLIPDAIQLFQAAWSPPGTIPHTGSSPDNRTPLHEGGSDYAADPIRD